MERLLLGSWYARPQASGLFKREWVQMVDHPNGRAISRVRAWDLAFTKPSEQMPNPDWTAGAYYEHAFSLVAAQLSQLLATIADGSAERKPQPIASPTPIARKLTKLDGFLSWETLAPCLQAAAADAPAGYTAAVTAALAAAEATFAENPVAHSLLTVVCSHLDSKYHSL